MAHTYLLSAVTVVGDSVIVDGRAALLLVCEECGLDPASPEHQHEALVELEGALDELPVQLEGAPVVLWDDE